MSTHPIQHHVEQWTGRVLRIGVWSSALLMIAGILLNIIRPLPPSAPPPDHPTLEQLAGRLIADPLNPSTLMYAGLILLMFTPLLRVLTALIGFAAERDRRFVWISVCVLVLLVGEVIYSLLLKG